MPSTIFKVFQHFKAEKEACNWNEKWWELGEWGTCGSTEGGLIQQTQTLDIHIIVLSREKAFSHLLACSLYHQLLQICFETFSYHSVYIWISHPNSLQETISVLCFILFSSNLLLLLLFIVCLLPSPRSCNVYNFCSLQWPLYLV